MGTTTTTGLMTFEEFERLPDEEFEAGKLELIEGKLNRMPPAEFKHNQTSHSIYEQLKDALRMLHSLDHAQDLGDVFHEMGYHFGNNWLQPDVSVTHAGQAVGKYLEGAPALAIEVLSKANTPRKVERKTRAYFANGAREVWWVYRDKRLIRAHRRDGVTEYQDTLTTDLLPGITIDLAKIFSSAHA